MRSFTSLRTQLTVLLAMPLTVLLAASALQVSHAAGTVHDRRTAAERVELSVAAQATVRQLAQERALSVSTLAVPGGTPAPDALAAQRDRTSEAVEELQSAVAADGAKPSDADPALAALRSLTATRQQVDTHTTSPGEVLGAYGQIIDPVLELVPADGAGSDPAIATELNAFDALSRGIQDVALEQALVSSVLGAGTIGPDTYQRLLGTVSNQGVWFDLFRRNATPAQLDSFDEAEAVTATEAIQGLRDGVLAAGPSGPVLGDSQAWSSAMSHKLELLDALADRAATRITGAAGARTSDATAHRTTALLLLGVALLFAAALVSAAYWLIGERLRRLADATRRAAADALPEAVEIAQAKGAEAARRAVQPMPRSGAAELDQIAAGVDVLQGTAIELAADGALLRDNVRSMFLNFGTRTQHLVTRQLCHIDDLEARTEDPDTLADLFLLDHLATRLRRNAEGLVVMAGADSPRAWARPVSAVNVVRAAAAEATDYSRVDVEPMAPAAVLGAAANDVSHLLAELLDNALAFSPPGSRVVVTGTWHPDRRYLVTVSDAGLGMSAAQLDEANRRIVELPLSESPVAGYFGLFVVGRFAHRHGIEVRLVPSPTDGVTAEVLLPETLLAGGQPALGPAPTPLPAPAPAPAPAPPTRRDQAVTATMALVPAGADEDAEAGPVPATTTTEGRAPVQASAPVLPLVPVTTEADVPPHRDQERHTAPPRWRRRRVEGTAGTRDDPTPTALGPAASPTTVGRGDD